MALTDTKLRSVKTSDKPLKLFDGGGLYLLVTPGGSKLWRYKYRIAGKENVYAIGAYPDTALSEARQERDSARKLVKQGIHPSHDRTALKARTAAESANTFQTVAEEWIGQNQATWRPYYYRQVTRMLAANVYPKVGALPIRAVTPAMLLEIIRRVEERGAKTVAILLRQWCSAIFRYAIATLRADSDAAAALRGAIARSKVEHHKPLSRCEIPIFLKDLEGFAGYRTTVIALRLLMLTFVRPGELRAATWQEFDLDRGEWRIPAERMKMGEAHVVPLSAQAIELLRELQSLTGGRTFLFPNYRNPRTCMTATTMNRALERMGYGGRFSSHGFRATASTILNEMNYRPDVIERQLAHKERNKVRASYNRAEYLPERRAMMQEWAGFLDQLSRSSNVIPMREQVA